MNDNINELGHSVEGLSIFIKKRIDAIVFKNNINLKSRWNLLRELNDKDIGGVGYYYTFLYCFIGISCVNFLISILAYSTFLNLVEDFGLLLASIQLGFLSIFVMAYLLRDDINHHIELNIMKDISLSKDEVMEVGMYLTQRDKEILINKINRNSKVSLKDIQNLLSEKEYYYKMAKEQLMKENKEKEIKELTNSINLLK